METLFVTCCVLEQYFDKSILHFNFSDDIKIKIFLCIEYSTVKEIFDEYFQETDFEYRGEQPQWCFTFGDKRLSLAGALTLSSDVSATTCQLLDYVRDYAEKEREVRVNLDSIVLNEYSIKSIAKNIVELLEE